MPRTKQLSSDFLIPYIKPKHIWKEVLDSAYMDSYIRLSGKLICESGNYFCTQMRDISMVNDGINKNDIIMVKKDKIPNNHDIVFMVLENQKKWYVRKYLREDHTIHLISASDEVCESFAVDERNSPFHIIGVVEMIIKEGIE